MANKKELKRRIKELEARVAELEQKAHTHSQWWPVPPIITIDYTPPNASVSGEEAGAIW